MPLGIFRVAKGHLSRLERQAIARRLGMFRVSVRHVSSCGMWSLECGAGPSDDKLLTIRLLRKRAENRVFAGEVGVGGFRAILSEPFVVSFRNRRSLPPKGLRPVGCHKMRAKNKICGEKWGKVGKFV